MLKESKEYEDFEWCLDDESQVAYIRINLRLKENANFDLNDGFIEAYKSLPITEEYEDYRLELQKKMVNSIDIINNINILSIFSVENSNN